MEEASPVVWEVVHEPIKTNLVGSSLTECMLVRIGFLLA